MARMLEADADGDSRDGCLGHATLNGPRRRALERLTSALGAAGFEIESRVSLSDLARERLGVEAPALEVLHLQHPLLLLQFLLAGGDPALLFPPIVILRMHEDSMEVCLRTPWPEGEGTMGGLSEELVKRAKERFRRALQSAILESGGRT